MKLDQLKKKILDSINQQVGEAIDNLEEVKGCQDYGVLEYEVQLNIVGDNEQSKILVQVPLFIE